MDTPAGMHLSSASSKCYRIPPIQHGLLSSLGDLLGADERAWSCCSTIVQQTGAMLAVCGNSPRSFFSGLIRAPSNLIVAFIPAAVLGLLARKSQGLHVPCSAGSAGLFIAGGLHHSLCERTIRGAQSIESVSRDDWRDALKVGFRAQCFVADPGTLRAIALGGDYHWRMPVFGFVRA